MKRPKDLAREIARELVALRKPAKGKKRPKATKAQAIAAEILAPRKPIVISESVMASSKRITRKERKALPVPFGYAQHPPGVVPEGRATLAQDSAIGAANAWATSGLIGGAFQEGLTFLGYPYLAELAQRPEYRVISETIATEITRRWIKLQATGDEDKSEKIKLIDAEMKRLGVQDAFRRIAEQDGFFGRAHLFLDFGDVDDRDELRQPIGDGRSELSKAKVGTKRPLKRVKPIEAVWCYPSNYNSNDPLKPDWYKPSEWFVQGKEVHASRLLTFVGREVPDLIKPTYSFGGLSMSQMAKPYVDNWLQTRQSVSDIISAFSVMVLKTNLAVSLDQGGDQLFKRADLFNNLRDNRGLMMIDKDSEDFANVSAPLTTLDTLQAQSQEHMAAVSRIPLVKLLGISPAGLNASSEGEIETFDDTMGAYQVAFFSPNLTRVINFIQLSLFDEVDPAITFAYEPLSSLTDKEKAEVEKIQAETDQIHIDSGVIEPVEARKRVAGDPDSGYTNLDLSHVPEPPGGEGGGGDFEREDEEEEDQPEAAHGEVAKAA